MLMDSGSTHCFISEHLAAAVQGRKAMQLQHPVQVRVANGDILQYTHELPDQLWVIQGITFRNSSKIIPFGCYDIILGMDWLAAHSPMEINWAEKWFQYNYKGKTVKIQGLQSEAILGLMLHPTS